MPKICNKCGKERELIDFSPNSKEKDGRARTCKVCRNAAKRQTVMEALNAIENCFEPKAEPDFRMQTRMTPAGPCSRCGRDTQAWAPLNPYKDPDDQVHLCPECKAHITFRWEGIWHLEVVMYQSPEDKEQWSRDKAIDELRELKDQVAKENSELEIAEAKEREAMKTVEYWMEDGTSREEATRQRDQYWKTQEERNLGEPATD